MQTYPTGYAESHHIAEQIFREILPRHGMAVREEQIALCHEVLDTLYNKEISLCEAGVGTGKTLAYLVGCILWQMNRPERMKLPIVISTSSVALQDAILTEYLPDLSAVLLDEGIITAPITAVVRKGKERFVCDTMTSLPQESSKRLLSTHGKKSKSTLSAVIPKRLTLYRAIHSYTNARTGKSKTLADAGITFWESELLHDGYRITDQTGTRASRPYTTKIG